MSNAIGNGQDLMPQNSIVAAGATGTADADLVEEYGRRIAGAASQARDFVTDKVGVVSDKLKELQDKDLGEVVDDAKTFARKNPGQAILISAAAGLVLGLLLRGRR
jgi:ElaB/YqjD/DUF883 family membrane-anchored ribosome-binding protein